MLCLNQLYFILNFYKTILFKSKTQIQRIFINSWIGCDVLKVNAHIIRSRSRKHCQPIQKSLHVCHPLKVTTIPNSKGNHFLLFFIVLLCKCEYPKNLVLPLKIFIWNVFKVFLNLPFFPFHPILLTLADHHLYIYWKTHDMWLVKFSTVWIELIAFSWWMSSCASVFFKLVVGKWSLISWLTSNWISLSRCWIVLYSSSEGSNICLSLICNVRNYCPVIFKLAPESFWHDSRSFW